MGSRLLTPYRLQDGDLHRGVRGVAAAPPRAAPRAEAGRLPGVRLPGEGEAVEGGMGLCQTSRRNSSGAESGWMIGDSVGAGAGVEGDAEALAEAGRLTRNSVSLPACARTQIAQTPPAQEERGMSTEQCRMRLLLREPSPPGVAAAWPSCRLCTPFGANERVWGLSTTVEERRLMREKIQEEKNSGIYGHSSDEDEDQDKGKKNDKKREEEEAAAKKAEDGKEKVQDLRKLLQEKQRAKTAEEVMLAKKTPRTPSPRQAACMPHHSPGSFCPPPAVQLLSTFAPSR